MSVRLRSLYSLYDQEPSPAVKAVSAALSPAGALYGGAMAMRRAAYRLGLFSVRRAPCRVVSVGALHAGGSGKTQVVMFLSALFASRGVRGAVVHGAYGGSARRTGAIVRVVPGADPAVCGDEAVLLASTEGGLPVYAGRARFETVVRAHREEGAAVCILDDAAQHMRIAREWNIIVADSASPFGNNRCIPAGPLREAPAALAWADTIWFVTHDRAAAEHPPVDRFKAHNDALRVVSSVTRPAVLALSAGGRLPPDAVEGACVLAFCGIGRPHRFFEMLKGLGPARVETMAFPDHHPFTRADTEEIAGAATDLDADMIVTTAKDHARSGAVLAAAFPYAALHVSIEVVSGQGVVEEIAELKVPERRVSPR